MITTVSLGTMIVQKRYNEIGEIADNEIIELEDSNNTNTTNETVNENNVIENNTVEEQKEIIQETNENENNNHKEKTIARNSNETTKKVETKKHDITNYSNQEIDNEDNTNNEASSPVEIATKPESEPEPVSVNIEPERKQPVWCDEGGSKHWQGNGPNEHGYYNTWDAAWQAAQEYMKDSLSGNFMVRQCPCGLYYYWVKKEN